LQNKRLLPKYIPELDGLRALAVTAVMLFHLNVPGFSLGWAGVYLFFVISGFLITGILLDTKNNYHYYRNFYARRILRIFPIYYLSLLVLTVAGLIVGWNIADFPYYVLYLQNYVFGLSRWQPNFPHMFDHTWSLAIEEQFYLVWPLLIFLLNQKQLRYLLLGLFVLAWGTRVLIFFTLHSRSLLFTPLPTALDSLSVGAYLALVARSRDTSPNDLAKRGALLSVFSGGGLILLAIASRLSSPLGLGLWVVTHSNLTLFALFFGGGLAFIVFRNTLLSSFLRMAWLRHIGKISYGLYLYHYPVYSLIDKVSGGHAVPEWLGMASRVVLTYTIALISWHFIESPLHALKKRFV